MQDPTDTARTAIRAWREKHPIDPSALTVDDLPAEMRTPEIREHLDAMSEEDRAFALFVGLAAATMTPAEREAVGFELVDRNEPDEEDMRVADEAAVKAIRERFPDAPADTSTWDTTPIRPAGDR